MPPRFPPAAAGSCGDPEIRGAFAKAAGPLHVHTVQYIHTYVSTRSLIRCGVLVG